MISRNKLGQLVWCENNEEWRMDFCGGTVFKLFPPDNKQGIPVTFYVRNDCAWGIKLGMRIFQRKDA